MKNFILAALITLTFSNSYSQEKDKFRVGLDFGLVPASGGGGLLFSFEPKYNLADNMNIGLRWGVAAIVKDVHAININNSAKASANSSFLGTYDFYFPKPKDSFVPYVGIGLGYYSLANVQVEANTSSQNTIPSVTGAMGGLVRGGFEWAKFRMGLEYNFIPSSKLQDLSGVNVGTVKNSYLGIHLGFYIGGGKWAK